MPGFHVEVELLCGVAQFQKAQDAEVQGRSPYKPHFLLDELNQNFKEPYAVARCAILLDLA
jgi:hypothetical protein